MPRMSKKRRLEWSFFLNHRNRITYNDLCRGCTRDCKQSFRAVSYYALAIIPNAGKKEDAAIWQITAKYYYLKLKRELFDDMMQIVLLKECKEALSNSNICT